MSARARFELDQLLALVVACAFLGTGIAKVAGVEFVMATFEGWTASPLLLRSIGLVELTCAVLVLVPRLRLVGTARAEERQEPEAHDKHESADQAKRLMDLARTLPEGYREPLLMRCVRGMSYRQIGEVLDLPETTIETRIARGRRMLRALVEQEDASSTNPAPASGGARVEA